MGTATNMHTIITHPGKMHTDDALSIGLAYHTTGVWRVERREPTEAELDDPCVLVLDVGGRIPWTTCMYL